MTGVGASNLQIFKSSNSHHMLSSIQKLETLLDATVHYLNATPGAELEHKPAPGKWSKKEILGHLIDSAINNLQRFTEIQFQPKPYNIRRYSQDELVAANDYQHADLQELIQCWLGLNRRILHLMRLQTPETLAFEILIGGDVIDLAFLMTDYVAHMEHHLEGFEDLKI